MRVRIGLTAVFLLALTVVVAACGGGGSSSSSATSSGSSGSTVETESASSSSESVNVDVGNGKTVELPKGKLKIGVLPNALSNEYTKVWAKSAEEEIEAKGGEPVLLDPNFDPVTQLNQVQTAIQQGSINAGVIITIDGSSMCNVLSKEAPEANVLISTTVTPICGIETKPAAKESPENLWSPGTLNFVGSSSFYGFDKAWAEEAGKQNPGPQKVAVILGPANLSQTHNFENAVKEYSEEHPEFEILGIVNTNFTSPDVLAKTANFLQANPDTTVIMSVNSPDDTRAIVQAVKEAGLEGKLTVGDIGASKYSFEQIEKGTLQYSMPYFPKNVAKLGVDSIFEAQEGKEVPRFVDDSEFGTAEEPIAITKANVKEHEPSF